MTSMTVCGPAAELSPQQRRMLAELRDAACWAVRFGWPIVPGTYWCRDRWLGSQEDVGELAPITENWLCPDHIPRSVSDAVHRWATTPYSVLGVCGYVFDTIMVSTRIGLEACRLLRRLGRSVPLIVIPGVGWHFFVQAGTAAAPELQQSPEMALHGYGRWVALPPTRVLYRDILLPVGWSCHPEDLGWQLPPSEPVQQLLVRAMRNLSRYGGDRTQ